MTEATLTINEASEVTGWSPRMLRYIDQQGLVEPPRSAGGYRLFRAQELQRLRTLRELLDGFSCSLSDLAFAGRIRAEPRLQSAVERWFESRPTRPAHIEPPEWLAWERDRHTSRWPRRLAEPETTPQETR
ncbi:MAG: MerR family transcriptional regulator [Solirubrobacterales bacterium]